MLFGVPSLGIKSGKLIHELNKLAESFETQKRAMIKTDNNLDTINTKHLDEIILALH